MTHRVLMTVPLDARSLGALGRTFTLLAVENYRRHGPFPGLRDALDSGRLVYQRERAGRDEWLLPSEAFERRRVDCEDLAGIRVGELVTSGDDPGAAVEIVAEDKPGAWHAIVRRSDGSFEDPTRYALALRKMTPTMKPTFRCHRASDGTDLATVTVPWADGNAYAFTAQGEDPAHALDAAADTAQSTAEAMTPLGLVDPEAVLAIDAIRTIARAARDGTLGDYAHQLGGGAKKLAHHLMKSLGIGGVGAAVRVHRGGYNYTVPRGEEEYNVATRHRTDRFGNPLDTGYVPRASNRVHRAPAAAPAPAPAAPQVPPGLVIDPTTGQLAPDPAYWASYGYDSWGGGYSDPWGGGNPWAQGAGGGYFPPGYFGGAGDPSFYQPYGMDPSYFGAWSPAWGAELASGADPYSALMGDQNALEGLFATYGVSGVRGVDGELARLAAGPVAGVDQAQLEAQFAAQRGA